MNRKRIGSKIALGVFSMNVLFFGGLSSNHVLANELESSAEVTLSKGIHLTEVPNFDFGTIIYNGEEKSYTLSGNKLGDKTLSWFDGTPSSEGCKVYAKISNLPQAALAEASVEITYADYTAVPKGSAWHSMTTSILTFDSEKSLIITTEDKQSKGGYYKNHKIAGTTDFKTADIEKKKINLPANLQSENVTLTVNWDIESSP